MTINSDDKIRWKRFLEGDNQALADIYQSNIDSLFNYGLKLTSNAEVVEDCIQDLFVLLLLKRSKLSETDNIRFYLLRSLRNSLIRKIQKENKISATIQDPAFCTEYCIERQLIKDESEAISREFLARVLKGLSPRQKEALYLKYTDGLSYEEISQLMDINYQACRNIVYKALKQLKAVIKKENIDLHDIVLLIICHSKNN